MIYFFFHYLLSYKRNIFIFYNLLWQHLIKHNEVMFVRNYSLKIIIWKNIIMMINFQWIRTYQRESLFDFQWLGTYYSSFMKLLKIVLKLLKNLIFWTSLFARWYVKGYHYIIHPSQPFNFYISLNSLISFSMTCIIK